MISRKTAGGVWKLVELKLLDVLHGEGIAEVFDQVGIEAVTVRIHKACEQRTRL